VTCGAGSIVVMIVAVVVALFLRPLRVEPLLRTERLAILLLRTRRTDREQRQGTLERSGSARGAGGDDRAANEKLESTVAGSAPIFE
jgi:hypothetical protein